MYARTSPFHDPRRRRGLGIPNLNPISTPAGTVGPIAAFGDDALRPERARVAEDGFAAAVEVLAQPAGRALRNSHVSVARRISHGC